MRQLGISPVFGVPGQPCGPAAGQQPYAPAREFPGVQPPGLQSPSADGLRVTDARAPGSGTPPRAARKPRIEIEVTPEEKESITADARAAGIRKVGRYARLVLLKRRRRGDVPASRVLAFANRVIALAEAGDVAAIRQQAEMVRSALQADTNSRTAAPST